MVRRCVFFAVLLVVGTVFLLNCSSNPVSSIEDIAVSQPSSNTVWNLYDTDLPIAWSGHNSDTVSISLYRGDTRVTTIAGSTGNSGNYTWAGPVPDTFTPGTNYRVRIEDGTGTVGWSAYFEVADVTGSEIITVSKPHSFTEWQHFHTGYNIEWNYPASRSSSGNSVSLNNSSGSTGNSTISPRPLSGDSVRIELWQGSDKIADIVSLSGNPGNYSLTELVPMFWGTGNNYRVKVVDNLGNFGYSEEFSIIPVTGSDVITVTQPNSSTSWEHNETGTHVVWNYPADYNNSSSLLPSDLNSGISPSPLSGDSVRIEIWQNDNKVGDYCGWIENTGNYTRVGNIPSSWGIGDNFKLKLIDSCDNFGWSEYFTINAADVFNFSKPVSSTVWMHYATDVPIEWDYTGSDSVQIVLTQSQVPVDTLSNGMISNTGSFVLPEVSDEWTPGTDYRIHIIDNYEDYGWSDEFEIALSSGAEVINVTEPGSGTVWEHFQTGYAVNWEYGQSKQGRTENQTAQVPVNRLTSGISLLDRFMPDNPLYGDEVLITLLKNSVVIDTLGGDWMSNTGTYTLTEGVSYYWGTGTDYQIHIEDNLGNYGTGELFQIFGAGGAEIITINNPTSSTTWSHYETETEVSWEYPALDSPLYEDSVLLQLWSNDGNAFVGNYSDGWVENTGTYIRTDGITAEWGIGSDYRIKAVDDLGNFGWSESFTIENGEGITVTVPDSSTSWMHYESNTVIQWDSTGIAGDEVIIQLFRGSNFVSTLVSGTDNDGEWINTGQIPDTWIPASNYRVKITDTYGDWGWSDEFEITASSGQQIYEITAPSSGTVWTHFDTNLPVNWNIQSDGTGAGSLPAGGVSRTSRIERAFADSGIIGRMFAGLNPSPLSGDSVAIELYKGGSLVATLTSSTYNDNGWTYSGPVPMVWTPGSDYQIKITDNLSNWGISDQFTIEEVSGQEIISVTNPVSSTIWRTLEPGTQITWEYPTDAGSDIFSAIPFAGGTVQRIIQANDPLFLDSISIEIWKDGSYLDDYSDGLVGNTGIYTRTESVSSSWGTGSTYQIKMIDTNSNFGFSDEFNIVQGEISVTNPVNGTVWNTGESGVQVDWTGGSSVVKLELWCHWLGYTPPPWLGGSPQF